MEYLSANGQLRCYGERSIDCRKNTWLLARLRCLNPSRVISPEAKPLRFPTKKWRSDLGAGATTLRSDVARLRARYRAILREEVSGTVIDPRDVDEELRHLRQVMAT